MSENRKSRRAAAKNNGQFSNKGKALTAVATGGLLVSPLVATPANALPGPVVTECSTGIGTGTHHNLGWAIDQINNGNGEGANYGPIGTTITFDLNAPCTLNLGQNQGYVIAESMNIQGPGEDQLILNTDWSEGSGVSAFNIDSLALTPTGTTTMNVTLHGMTIDGLHNANDQDLIHATDSTGALMLTLDHMTVKNANGYASGVSSTAVSVSNGDGVDDNSRVTISHSTFSNNNVALATVQLDSASADISDSTFSNNVSNSFTGGIYSSNGSVTIEGSKFDSNSGTPAGAAVANSVTVSGSTFTSNVGSLGSGAIWGYNVVDVTDSQFSNNWSEGASGGALNSGGTLLVEGSSFVNNSANNEGGAIYVNGQIVALNNTFVGNQSTNANGGAIWAEGGSLDSNTFVNNHTPNYGDVVFTPGSVSLYANLIDDAAGDSCGGTIVDRGANLSTARCGADYFPNYVAGNHDVSATVTHEQLDLQTAAVNKKYPSNAGTTKTVALGKNSVAREYYSASPVPAPGARMVCISEVNCEVSRPPAVDQRGVSRPQGLRNDVGAYEGGASSVAAVCTPIHIPSIKFKPNSAKLTKNARKSLLDSVKTIKDSGCHTVVLNGYTAKVSNGKAHKVYRKMLAKKRNSAVKKYLTKQFDAANYSVTFETHAFGGANPKASNKSSKGRKQNRRVEIVIKKLRGFSF